MSEDKQKVKISIIDFMPFNGKYPVGKDKNGTTIHYGDMVEYNGEKNWFVGYRYGEPMLKQVGMMAMIGSQKYKDGDFSNVEKVNVFGAGTDWLIIGYTDEPLIQELLPLFEHETHD